jgi:hypothetical protein
MNPFDLDFDHGAQSSDVFLSFVLVPFVWSEAMATRSHSRKAKVVETVVSAKGVNESLTSADQLEADVEPEGKLEADPEGELVAAPTVEPDKSEPPTLPPPEALAALEEPPPPPPPAAAAAAVPTASAAAAVPTAPAPATAAAAAEAVAIAPPAVETAPAVALSDSEYRSEYGYTESEYYCENDDGDWDGTGYSDYGAGDDHYSYLYKEDGGNHHDGHSHVGYRGYPSLPAAVEPAEQNQPNQPSGNSSQVPLVQTNWTCGACTFADNKPDSHVCAICNKMDPLESTVSAPELKPRGTIEYGPIKTTVNIGGATFTMCQAKFTGEQHGFGPGLQRSQPECTDANFATILTVYKADVTFHKPFLCEAIIVDGKVMLSCRRVDKSTPTGNTCPTEQWAIFQALDPKRIHAAIAKHHHDDLTRKQEQSTLVPAGFTSPSRTRGTGPRRRGRTEREREMCVCVCVCVCVCTYEPSVFACVPTLLQRAPSPR